MSNSVRHMPPESSHRFPKIAIAVTILTGIGLVAGVSLAIFFGLAIQREREEVADTTDWQAKVFRDLPAPSIDIDPSVLDFIVGDYKVVQTYVAEFFEDTLTFADDSSDFSNVRYSFFPDLTFEIEHQNSRTEQGSFTVEKILIDDVPDLLYGPVPYVEDRLHMDLYRILLIYDNNHPAFWMELFMSCGDADDIIFYQTHFGRAEIAQRIP